MAARIRSSVAAKPTLNEVSRDDLGIGDVVNLTSIDAATTYFWELAFVPEGSIAVLSSNNTINSDFTVDLVGPYLVRLTTDMGAGTESTQYVRLRALTSILGLHLIAAGERRDITGVIPVDADIEGWANEQNSNLLALETAIVPNAHSEKIRLDFDFTTVSPISFGSLSVGDVVTKIAVKVTTEFDDNSSTVEIGDSVNPSSYLTPLDSAIHMSGTYIKEGYEDVLASENLKFTLNSGASTQGAGFVILDLFRA